MGDRAVSANLAGGSVTQSKVAQKARKAHAFRAFFRLLFGAMQSWQERLFRFAFVRYTAGALALLRALLRLSCGRTYSAMVDFCWIVRVANTGWPARVARRHVFRLVEIARSNDENPLVSAYLQDSASKDMANAYALSGCGKHDLFRDLIVLKQRTAAERGVILLKYARTFSATVALLDLRRLTDHYVFVLEPCWSGYCDPSVLMFLRAGNPVLVQCFTEPDYRFIADVGAPLTPVRLGPADWVNADVFAPPISATKPYDLVMVANWASHKRHARLFHALQKVRDRDVRVLLVGFPWANRSADDIRREAAAHRNDRVTIDIRESVPQRELARYVAECKAFVFLSRKEGDNKAVVEAMFADVPAIVYDKSIGGAVSRINAQTGLLASDEELAEKIVYMLDHYREFTPRAWALQNTGSRVATAVLDEALRRVITAAGGQYRVGIVEKTNAPNLAYKDPARRSEFQADYDFILSCLRARTRDAAPETARAAA